MQYVRRHVSVIVSERYYYFSREPDRNAKPGRRRHVIVLLIFAAPVLPPRNENESARVDKRDGSCRLACQPTASVILGERGILSAAGALPGRREMQKCVGVWAAQLAAYCVKQRTAVLITKRF